MSRSYPAQHIYKFNCPFFPPSFFTRCGATYLSFDSFIMRSGPFKLIIIFSMMISDSISVEDSLFEDRESLNHAELWPDEQALSSETTWIIDSAPLPGEMAQTFGSAPLQGEMAPSFDPTPLSDEMGSILDEALPFSESPIVGDGAATPFEPASYSYETASLIESVPVVKDPELYAADGSNSCPNPLADRFPGQPTAIKLYKKTLERNPGFKKIVLEAPADENKFCWLLSRGLLRWGACPSRKSENTWPDGETYVPPLGFMPAWTLKNFALSMLLEIICGSRFPLILT
jgi:hypothetical protein